MSDGVAPKTKNEHEIRIVISDSEKDLGVFVSIQGAMRLIDMLAISYMMLNASVDAGAARLGGALEAVKGAVEAVRRTLNDEYPGTSIEEAKN